MKTVFIVDDDGLLREVLTRSLQKNYHVRTFGSPREALSEVHASLPDIVVSDVQMPEMTGIELIEAIRAEWPDLPVIVMSGHLSIDVEQRARALGASDVISKPIKDPGELAASIAAALASSADSAPHPGLDHLRLSFLTGLSHELRTPLTAIKIALDGLFADHVADATPSSQKLIAISQRNVDRIVRLVERQLDLLQVTLGEITVARRLVSLDEVIENAARLSGSPISQRRRVSHAADQAGTYVFTDPERLQGVIEHLLGGDPDTSIVADDQKVVIEFAHSGAGREHYGRMVFGGIESLTDQLSKASVGDLDLEQRACWGLVDALGGRIRVANDGIAERTRLSLPVLPDYDPRSDFTLPLEQLRRAAILNGKRITVIRCDVNGMGNNQGQAVEGDFLRRCLTSASDGDVVVRGEKSGEYYVALLDRSDKQIAEITAFLQTEPSTERSTGVKAREVALDPKQCDREPVLTSRDSS